MLTHYQRTLKKNILITGCGPVDSSNVNLFVSCDQKVYICPGTGTRKS